MQSDPKHENSRLDAVARIMQIAMAVSIIIGIFVALYGLYDIKSQADLSLKSMRLTQLKVLREMIKADKAFEDKTITPFMNKLRPNKVEPGSEAENCGNSYDKEKRSLIGAEAMFEEYNHTGRDMYKDPCLKEFVAVGRHYDELGAIVRLGYLDFDLLFTLFAFPDDFWDETRDYRFLIQKNWGGENQELSDFWINFSWLRDEYLKARKAGQ